MNHSRYVLIKTLTGKYHYGKSGYDNIDINSNPVKLNYVLIPLSNIDWIRVNLSYEQLQEWLEPEFI